MWRVLLVEDEPFVRRSIRNAIQWETFGFTVAAEAGDGREALEYMESNRVDVVISDILMPFMGGIELLQASKARGDEVKFVMLTCLNEFEFARQALQHGASGYVLKLSMDTNELHQLLGKIGAELAQKRERELARSLPPVYEAVWAIIHRKERGPDEEKPWRQRMSQPDLPEFVQIFSSVGQTGSALKERVLAQYNPADREKLIVHSYETFGQSSVFVWNDAAVRFSGDSADSWGELGSTVGTPFIRSGRLTEGWAAALVELSKYWYGLKRRQRELFMLGVIGEAVTGAEAETLTWKEERGVLQHFEQMRWAECKSALRSVWESMGERQVPIALVLETAERIEHSFAQITGKAAGADARVSYADSHEGLLQALYASIDEYSLRNTSPAKTDHPEINKIMEYVARHLDHELTLKAMAGYVNMDEQYLSGLFKKKTGETFIQYVQRVRIEQAQVYLKETKLAVAEICERVGFAHINYFLKVFKKWTGQSPNEYRMSGK